MRVLFLSDNFPPEANAPAIRTFEHCREWVKAGVDVTVVTCAPNFPSGRVFPGYRNRLVQREEMEGIHVVRVWSYMAPNAGFLRRVLDYASYAASPFLVGLWQPCDLIVATSPQFFTTFAGSALARVLKRPWVFELRDLWPESIVATGAMRPGAAIQALERVELALYRDADLVVAVTEAFKRNLAARGVPQEKVVVVPNGVLPELFRVRDSRPVARRPGEEFLVGYVGTHGMAHGLDVVLDVAESLRDLPCHILMVGEGSEKARLQANAADRGLENVEFLSAVPRKEVPDLLRRLDVMLVPLKGASTFETVIPSKIFEAAAAGCPIVLSVDGEAKLLVEQYGAGLAVRPEDATAIAAAVTRLANDPALYENARQGCARLAAAYDRQILARRMLEALDARWHDFNGRSRITEMNAGEAVKSGPA